MIPAIFHTEGRDTQERRVFGLDLLRASAISLVMIDHARVFFSAIWPDRLIDALYLGDVGVDLFFVLSGFLIGGILLRSLNSRSSLRDLFRFWGRRWWRTLPNYYLFLAVNLFLSLLLGHLRTIGPYLVFSQSMFKDTPRFFGESWSLCVEEWFYLIFPVFTFAGSIILSSGTAYLLAAIAIACASLAMRSWLVHFFHLPFEDAHHATFLRLDSLMFGVVGAYLSARWPGYWRRAARPAAVAGLLLSLLAVVVRWKLSDDSLFSRLVFFDVVALGFAALLPLSSLWEKKELGVFSFITLVSQYSYSIYLVNRPLREVMFKALGLPGDWIGATSAAIVWLIAAYALSSLCYHAYESPLRRLRDLDLWASLWPVRPLA